MFSGIVAHRGVVVSNDALDGGGAALCVRSDAAGDEGVTPKDSVAIDGVCLTATKVSGGLLSFDVVPETLARTTLGDRVPGDRVNLEFALRAGDRIGGHFVYGHVDAVARVLSRGREGQGERVRFELPAALAFGIVEKAFVAVDGVSLTVAAAGDDWFEVAVIPETLARTTLGERALGGAVNLEIDPLARYAAVRRP